MGILIPCFRNDGNLRPGIPRKGSRARTLEGTHTLPDNAVRQVRIAHAVMRRPLKHLFCIVCLRRTVTELLVCFARSESWLPG